MKKTTLLLVISTGVLLITTLVLAILLIKETKDNNTMTEFGANMITSFSNAIDYTLCNNDAFYGNANFKVCEAYLDTFLADAKLLRENIGLETKYNYIGE